MSCNRANSPSLTARKLCGNKKIPAPTASHLAAVVFLSLAHAAHAVPIALDLPAQPLAAALRQVATAAGLQLTVDKTLLQDRNASALEGRMEVEDAFARLLAGSGLEVVAEENGYRLRRVVRGQGEAMLPTVTVTADRDNDNGDTGYGATIASSATRLPAALLDTDRSVQVVTGQLIEDRAILDPQEAIQNVSGVQRGFTRTGVGEAYTLRGFAQQALFKDGFRVGVPPATFSPFAFEGPNDIANLERVEVLKGPSSILYGRGEPGGTVNYVTRTPDSENNVGFQQYLGNFDFYRTEVYANAVSGAGTADAGRFAARLDAAYQTNDSFIDFVEAERTFLAPSARWKMSPDTTLTFRGEYANDDHSTSLDFPAVDDKPLDGVSYDTYFGEPGFTEIESDSLRGLATLDHRWNEHHSTTVSLHGARAEGKGGNILLFNFAGPLQEPVTGAINRIAEDVDFQSEYFTARLDHIWDTAVYTGSAGTSGEAGWRLPAIDNQLLVSLDFDRQTVDGNRGLSAAAPLDPFNPVYAGFTPIALLPFPGFPAQFFDESDVEADANSILLLDRLHFGESVILSFGGRYERFDATSRLQFLPAGAVPFPGSDNETDEETFNPTLGLLVKPLPYLSLYTNYANRLFPSRTSDSRPKAVMHSRRNAPGSMKSAPKSNCSMGACSSPRRCFRLIRLMSRPPTRIILFSRSTPVNSAAAASSSISAGRFCRAGV